ncbi:MAG TPA: hypothetical protein VFM18_13215, partial [Methanosarcina sp.]|nr:hypothetical protein [Methanosarcina sp.]
MHLNFVFLIESLLKHSSFTDIYGKEYKPNEKNTGSDEPPHWMTPFPANRYLSKEGGQSPDYLNWIIPIDRIVTGPVTSGTGTGTVC